MKDLGQITIGALLVIFVLSLIMILFVSILFPLGMVTGIELGGLL